MRENCKYGLMRGNRTSFTDDPKRAQSWKRRIQPRISLRNDEPVLYSTKLQRLKPGARVVAHDFDIDEWKPTKIDESSLGSGVIFAIYNNGSNCVHHFLHLLIFCH